jgi:hypothetical protein
LATCFETARTSAHCSFMTMVSTQLVIQKKLNILCLPLTMQLRWIYMPIRATPIGMRVLLCSVFLVYRLPRSRRISDTLFHTMGVVRSSQFASSSTAVAATIWRVPCW